MPSHNDLRERVKSKAQEAVDKEFGRDTTTDDADTDSDEDDSGHTEDLLSPTEIMDRGWEVEDYNSFFGDCRESGFSSEACGEMWGAVKDADMAEPGTPEQSATPDSDAEGGGQVADVVLVKNEHDASEKALKYLAESINDGDVGMAVVESDEGQDLLESLDEVPPVPAHIMVDAETGGAEVGDIETLLREHVPVA